MRNFPRGRGKRPAYVGGKPSSTHPKAAKKKLRPEERGAKRAPPRRGSLAPSFGVELHPIDMRDTLAETIVTGVPRGRDGDLHESPAMRDRD